MIFIISWKNIWRNKLRSSIIIAAIALGLFGGIFSMACMNGMGEQRVRSAIQTQISNIQIHNPNFLKNKKLKYSINNADSIINIIKQYPSVKAVCKRTIVTAMASTAETGTGIVINGINPDKEIKVTDISKKITSGNYFTRHKKHPILISEKLARKLKAKIRSKIVITTQNNKGNLIGGAFRVIGIFKTADSFFDETHVFVLNNDLDKLVYENPKNYKAHEIAILLFNDENTKKLVKDLKLKFNNLSIQSWDESQADLKMMSSLMDSVSYLFLSIILLALTFAIINTMLMAVFERTHEFGMLMAIGMSKIKIFNMIVSETILLSIIGAAIGTLISLLNILFFHIYGINLAIVSKGLSSFGIDSVIYPEVDISFYLILSIMVIFTAILASIYPAMKALSNKPVEALRAE
ncbi:MAG: ABC transporter permease [Bacteroidales bacterium]|nr:ABC transporter permease [Bacteroidales bacterium]